MKRERGLRVTDPETARVVALHGPGEIVGAGCLLDATRILSCRHVVQAAGATEGDRIKVTLSGVRDAIDASARIDRIEDTPGFENDLALLVIENLKDLRIPLIEFASPLRHAEKKYSVMGFPDHDAQGRNASGTLNAADANGLVQMDRGKSLLVRGGFSGAPVYSSDLAGFVGIVVSEYSQQEVAWCIPSRRLSRFLPDIPVRFRIVPSDRPVIHDLEEDDPNLQLFGEVSDDGDRQLTASVKKRVSGYRARIEYRRIKGSPPARGRLVTFVTYPGFGTDGEDSYELFSHIKDDMAWQEFYPADLFTVAAFGDAGDTVLTLDLATLT
jgi:hypothetical protein